MSGSQSFSKRSVSNTKRKSKRLHSSRVGDNEGGGRLDLVVLWTRSQRELTETFLVYTSQPFPCSSDIRSVSQTERLGTGYYKPCYLTGQIVQSNACLRDIFRYLPPSKDRGQINYEWEGALKGYFWSSSNCHKHTYNSLHDKYQITDIKIVTFEWQLTWPFRVHGNSSNFFFF